VLEAARVYRLTRADWIIASGGVLNERDEPDGRIIRDALARLNVPTSRILVEADSRTTRDQAVLVAPILRSIAAERVIIVTSDVHMPRALWAFRAVGVTAIPAIAPDPHRADPLGSRLLPSSHGLGRSKQVSHELVGIAYYTVRRWLAF
jgi:uncharacterized SAM-binding protein YcdF (DUF218 family)